MNALLRAVLVPPVFSVSEWGRTDRTTCGRRIFVNTTSLYKPSSTEADTGPTAAGKTCVRTEKGFDCHTNDVFVVSRHLVEVVSQTCCCSSAARPQSWLQHLHLSIWVCSISAGPSWVLLCPLRNLQSSLVGTQSNSRISNRWTQLQVDLLIKSTWTWSSLDQLVEDSDRPVSKCSQLQWVPIRLLKRFSSSAAGNLESGKTWWHVYTWAGTEEGVCANTKEWMLPAQVSPDYSTHRVCSDPAAPPSPNQSSTSPPALDWH